MREGVLERFLSSVGDDLIVRLWDVTCLGRCAKERTTFLRDGEEFRNGQC